MKVSIFVLISIFSKVAYSQSFEGTLGYVLDIQISEKMTKMGITKEIMVDKMKKEGLYFDTLYTSYKNGNYFTFSNSSKSNLIYRKDSNKIYTFSDGNNSDECTVTDASIDVEFALTGKQPVISILDTLIVVNGIDCSIVRVKWKSGYYDYYYNKSKLSIDPKLFTGHLYDGWLAFTEISNALPLKIVKFAKGLSTITLTLFYEKKENIDDKLFLLPNIVNDSSLNLISLPGRVVMKVVK